MDGVIGVVVVTYGVESWMNYGTYPVRRHLRAALHALRPLVHVRYYLHGYCWLQGVYLGRSYAYR